MYLYVMNNTSATVFDQDISGSQKVKTTLSTHETVDVITIFEVMIISRAKTAKSQNDLNPQKINTKDRNASKWRFENTSEASVLGNQFAQVIMMVASGSSDQILQKKNVHSPCKKVFWEEPRFNPAIENTNDTYAHNAHRLEETKYWKRKGKRFVTGPRFAQEASNRGPLIPAEIEHLFEKPTVVFERSGQLRPFSRARKFNVPHEHCTPNPERAYQETRTSLIGPTTYHLPDFWDSTTSHPIEPKLSSMRSATPRFPGERSLRSDFPLEKSGTSIPHSRGRSRGAGFKETSRPLSQSELAARIAANSISSWESFQEAPSPEFNRFGSCSISADSIVDSTIPAEKFYEVSADLQQTNGNGSAQKQRKHALNKNNHSSSQQRMHNLSTGSLVGPKGANNTSHSPLRTASTAPTTSDHAFSRSNSFVAEGNLSAPSSSQRRMSKGNIPGFTMSTKSAQPLFAVPDYHKSYKRMILPDGTVGILPVTGESAASEPLTNTAKSVSFNVDPRIGSSQPQLAVGGGLVGIDPVLQLLGNSGPQIRSMTPPRPSPPSLTRNNLYSNLLAASPSRASKSGSTVLDDESTGSQAVSVKTTTNTASSYGRAVVQKWVPPVSYSSRNKGPVPDIGAIPYKPKMSSPYGVRRSADQFALLEGDSTFAQSLVDDLLPLDRPSSRGFSPSGETSGFLRPVSGSGDLRRGSKLGGINAGERKRQDSLGAQALSLAEGGLRKSVSKESAQVLQYVEAR